MAASRPPVVIIGMHRSGTSLIADVLETLGLFMGQRKDPNGEALFFLELNEWLLRCGNAAWDHTEPMDELLEHEQSRTMIADHLRFHIRSPRTIAYLGLRKYLQYRRLDRVDTPWGWKDPRNTYTLPIWLDVFPDARVIHIYRNGVDVASSLRKRSQPIHECSSRTLRRWQDRDGRILYGLFPRMPSFRLRQLTLERGFALWETYVQRANEHIRALPRDRTASIRYEAFLAQPEGIILELCQLAGIQPSREQVKQAITQVNPERANAYEHSPELRAFYEAVKDRPLMRQLQYA